MNVHQFARIATKLKLGEPGTPRRAAVWDVVHHGKSATASEKHHRVPAGTVARDVKRVRAELSYCLEVVAYAHS